MIVPDLTRAAADGRLTAEFVSYASALLAIALPLTSLTFALSRPLGDAADRHAAAAVGVDRVARDRLARAGRVRADARRARGQRARRTRQLRRRRRRLRRRSDRRARRLRRASPTRTGIIALAWGLALNGALAAGIPLSRSRAAVSSAAPRRRRGDPRPAAQAVRGVAVPLAMQGLYVIALRGASGLGEGNQTSLTYAYPVRIDARRGDGDLALARLVGAADAPGPRRRTAPPRTSCTPCGSASC